MSIRSFENFLFHFLPDLFWRPYSRKAREIGIERLYAILSFDSDTDEDAKASSLLFERLEKLDIPCTFAVPGSQLKSGKKIYRELHQKGAAFINHGGGAHTEFRDGRYWSKNFYNRMTVEEVKTDIAQGHEIFEQILGESPQGFRAPHFGHFQRKHQLVLIYQQLRKLGGYTFASTTLPKKAQYAGPIYEDHSIWEIPVTGSYDWPTRLFDSWGHVENKEVRRANEFYGQRLFQSVEKMLDRGFPAVLNFYADPSHVIESSSYFKALEEAKEKGVTFINYPNLIDMVSA